MKALLFAILGPVGVLVSSCGVSTDNQITPEEAVLASEIITNGQRIACFYYNPNEPDFGQSRFAKQSFEWAVDDRNGDNFAYLTGEIQDSFFVADQVYSSDLLGFSRSAIDNSQEIIEAKCRYSIKKKYPQFELISISTIKLVDYVASKFRAFIPIVFANMDNSERASRLVIFGDSLSDDGNLFASTLQTFPKPPYFLGRFSNGPIWADYLKGAANLAVRNRSYGGAQTATDPNDDILGSIILGAKNAYTGTFAQYVSLHLAEDLKGGPLEAASQKKTIYLIWIGANDYFGKWIVPGALNTLIDNPPNNSGSSDNVSKHSVEQIALQLENLYAAGAQKFVIINLPDFGLTPFAAEDKTYHQGPYKLSFELTKLIKKFNQILSDKLAALKSALPNAKIYEIDAFAVVNQVLRGEGPQGESAFNYGFDSSYRTELTFEGQTPITVYKQCYTGGYSGSGGENVMCNNVQASFFFDSAHPSSRSHCWLSFYIQRELYKNELISEEPKVESYMQMCNPPIS